MQTLCELTDAIEAVVHRDTDFATFSTAMENIRSRMFPPKDAIRVMLDAPAHGVGVSDVINALLGFAASVALQNIPPNSVPEFVLESLQQALAFQFNKVRKQGVSQ